jgi:hypothetical protein
MKQASSSQPYAKLSKIKKPFSKFPRKWLSGLSRQKLYIIYDLLKYYPSNSLTLSSAHKLGGSQTLVFLSQGAIS